MQFQEIKVAGLASHPKQFLFADVSGAEYKEFVESVRTEGLKQPLIVSERTGVKVIVDGHQRLRAALEVGLRTLPAMIQPFADEREEVGVMIAANLKRRQLTRKQKAEVVAEYIKLFSERSDNWIAEDLGVHNETVTSKREELEESGQVTETVTLKGKDGKEYPRRQGKTPKPKPARDESESTSEIPKLDKDEIIEAMPEEIREAANKPVPTETFHSQLTAVTESAEYKLAERVEKLLASLAALPHGDLREAITGTHGSALGLPKLWNIVLKEAAA